MFNFRKEHKAIKTPPLDSGYFSEYSKSDWEKLTSEKRTYMIEESRLCLQNIFEGTVSLAQKAAFLLTLIWGLISYMFVEFMTKYNQCNINDWRIWLIAVYFVILICAFLVLIRYLLPLPIYPLGTSPQKLLPRKEAMDSDFAEIIVAQLKFYQARIDHNRKLNAKIAQKVYLCAILIAAYPILVSLVVFVIFFLNHYWSQVCRT
jgi:MFS family permease